jgi:hypothetical protein
MPFQCNVRLIPVILEFEQNKLVLLFLWTWSIIQNTKNEATAFQELALLPSSGNTGTGIRHFYWTQYNKHFHLKTGAQPAPKM